MNDKDRDLIQQILAAAGHTGERGFAYLVHYQFIDGVTGLLGYGTLIAAASWAIYRLFSWLPDEYNDGSPIVKGIGIVVVSIAWVICVACFFGSLTQVLAPEGAAINAVLHK